MATFATFVTPVPVTEVEEVELSQGERDEIELMSAPQKRTLSGNEVPVHPLSKETNAIDHTICGPHLVKHHLL